MSSKAITVIKRFQCLVYIQHSFSPRYNISWFHIFSFMNNSQLGLKEI